MRYLLRRALDVLGFSSPDRTLDTRETLALGHLTVVALLRVLVLFGASLRYAVHLKRYAADPVLLWAVTLTVGGFALYIAAIFWSRARRRSLFLSEPLQWVEMALDVIFLSSMYYLTGNNESDFFLFFVIPLMLPTTMNWRLKSYVSIGLCTASFLTLVLVMPNPKDAIEASVWYKDLLRVFAPRMVFMVGVWLAVNIMMEFRRDVADEQSEKRALQEMLDKMRRSAETEPEDAAPGPVAASGGPLQVGQTLGGRYELVGVLGRGGMGEVFQARDVELDDVVALKVLSAAAPTREGTLGLATLKQEIRTARRITHPNVVRVHDLSELHGVRFLTMEYVPGTTLRTLAERRGKLPLGPGLQIFKQLLSGLVAVHKAGIIHRDIKPENVMVLPNGMVKLMDFGLAEVAQDTGAAGGGGFVVGSPYYMSPEQLQSLKVDPRSDLYSVGVVMFEIFTGQHPFPSKRLAEVIQHHVYDEPPAPRSIQPDLPEALERIILHCLRKDPAERPDSGLALYAALLNTSSA